MSPNFPDEYPKRVDCIWTINVPVSNQIELNITQFQLEKSDECKFDFVEIRCVLFKYKIIWRLIITLHFL